MTQSPYICSCPVGHEIIYLGKSDELLFTPIVAWEMTGTQVVPLALFPILTALAVLFPDGQVVDLDSRETWLNLESWRQVWRDRERSIKRQVKALPDENKSAVETPMPDRPSKAIADLGLSGRAVAPMERAGLHTVRDLSTWLRRDVLDIRGVPSSAGKVLDAALAAEDLSWLTGTRLDKKLPEPEAPEADDDDSDVEDMI